MSQSATAPDKMRMKVKLDASIVVRFSACRQRRELPANAIIASSVRTNTRIGLTLDSQTRRRNFITRTKRLMPAKNGGSWNFICVFRAIRGSDCASELGGQMLKGIKRGNQPICGRNLTANRAVMINEQ